MGVLEEDTGVAWPPCPLWGGHPPQSWGSWVAGLGGTELVTSRVSSLDLKLTKPPFTWDWPDGACGQGPCPRAPWASPPDSCPGERPLLSLCRC